MVYTADSKSVLSGVVGSSPTSGTNFNVYMTIQENRSHTERFKEKRKRYNNANTSNNPDVAVGRVCTTPALCSCYMCGNPRKFFNELTIQEKKFKDVEKEFLDFE